MPFSFIILTWGWALSGDTSISDGQLRFLFFFCKKVSSAQLAQIRFLKIISTQNWISRLDGRKFTRLIYSGRRVTGNHGLLGSKDRSSSVGSPWKTLHANYPLKNLRVTRKKCREIPKDSKSTAMPWWYTVTWVYKPRFSKCLTWVYQSQVVEFCNLGLENPRLATSENLGLANPGHRILSGNWTWVFFLLDPKQFLPCLEILIKTKCKKSFQREDFFCQLQTRIQTDEC